MKKKEVEKISNCSALLGQLGCSKISYSYFKHILCCFLTNITPHTKFHPNRMKKPKFKFSKSLKCKKDFKNPPKPNYWSQSVLHGLIRCRNIYFTLSLGGPVLIEHCSTSSNVPNKKWKTLDLRNGSKNRMNDSTLFLDQWAFIMHHMNSPLHSVTMHHITPLFHSAVDPSSFWYFFYFVVLLFHFLGWRARAGARFAASSRGSHVRLERRVTQTLYVAWQRWRHNKLLPYKRQVRPKWSPRRGIHHCFFFFHPYSLSFVMIFPTMALLWCSLF